MFLPSQVQPYLQHREKPVRDLAIRYLEKAHDASPVTADDIWRVIDKFGAGEHGGLYRTLAAFHSTEQSIERTIKALESSPDDENVRLNLEHGLMEISYAMLLRMRDLIEESQIVPEHVRTHLQQRLALAQVPRNDLLEQLDQLAERMDQGDDAESDEQSAENYHLVDRLIEALARHPESAPWAISTLNDPSVNSWLEIWAVELLGRMHFRPAAELIVQKMMADEEADFLIESSMDALGRIGSADVVRIIRERYGSMSPGIRLHATEAVSRIKLPQSESALVAMLNSESDRMTRTHIAQAMCQLCVSEPPSLGKLRDIVNEGKWDLTIADLDEDVAALFTIVGHEVPELSRWRAQSADKGARAEARKQEYNKLFRDNQRAMQRIEQLHDKEQLTWDEDVPPWEASEPQSAQTDAPVIASRKTIRRETPKVGRNDPCPCGSGKKYKKCCGK